MEEKLRKEFNFSWLKIDPKSMEYCNDILISIVIMDDFVGCCG